MLELLDSADPQSDPETAPGSALGSFASPDSQSSSAKPTSDAITGPTDETSQRTSQSNLPVPEKPKKKRSLLKVSSRSSSHTKQEPSATSTAFTGATATDDAVTAGNSGKNSLTGRRRNGSRTSSEARRAQQEVASTTNPAPMASGTSSTAPKKKSSFSFLSFLNCCGGPTGTLADTDDSTLPPKPSAVPKTQPTRGRQPEVTEKQEKTTSDSGAVGVGEVLNEKVNAPDSTEGQTAPLDEQSEKIGQMPGPVTNTTDDAIPIDSGASERAAYDPPLPPPPASEKSPISYEPLQTEDAKYVNSNADAPHSIVAAPVVTSGWQQKDEKRSSDVVMGEAPPLDQHEAVEEPLEPIPEPEPEVAATQPELPPPPPRTTKEQPPLPAVGQEKQQWLLPPAQAPLKGRKCLVLDLDETLVHSSFKVSFTEFSNHGLETDVV